MVDGLVEKPDPASAPSHYAVLGRYILTHEILEGLGRTDRGVGGEIQLTDALADHLSQGRVVALEFDGVYHDTGTVSGYLKAVVALALEDPVLGPPLREFLGQLMAVPSA